MEKRASIPKQFPLEKGILTDEGSQSLDRVPKIQMGRGWRGEFLTEEVTSRVGLGRC